MAVIDRISLRDVGRIAVLVAAMLATLVSAAHALSTPTRDGWVTDEAGIIDPETASVLARYLVELQRNTGAEVVVVTLKSLQGASIETWGSVLGESWGIGRGGGKDNGALLIVAPNDRKVRIAVGYGLGGRLSDSAAAAIVANDILPYFRRGDVAAGIKAGVDSISARIEGDVAMPALESNAAPVGSSTRSRTAAAVPYVAIIVGLLLAALVVVLIMQAVYSLRSAAPAPSPTPNANPKPNPDPAGNPVPDPNTNVAPPSNNDDGIGGFISFLLSNNRQNTWGNSSWPSSSRSSSSRSSSSWSSSSWSSSSSSSSSSGRSWSGGSSSGGSGRSFGGGASGSW